MFNKFFSPKNRVTCEIVPKNMMEPERSQMTVQYGAWALHAGLVRLHARTHTHKPTRPKLLMKGVYFYSPCVPWWPGNGQFYFFLNSAAAAHDSGTTDYAMGATLPIPGSSLTGSKPPHDVSRSSTACIPATQTGVQFATRRSAAETSGIPNNDKVIWIHWAAVQWHPRQRRESVLGEQAYISTHSLASVLNGSNQVHAPAALPRKGTTE